MNTSFKSGLRQLLLAFVLALGAVGCTPLVQLSKNIVDNAPAAAPPVIVRQQNLKFWQHDATGYSKWPTFNVDVRYGLGNHLTLLENGVVVPRFDSNDPSNSLHTVYTSTDVSNDTAAQTITSHLRIMPSVAGYPEGQVINLTLQETSINPKYRGTPQETASTSFSVASVKKPCALSIQAPATANQGDRISVSWSALACKEYDLYIDGQIQEGRIYPTPAGDRSDTITLNADKSTRTVKLRGINATGDVVYLEKTVNVTMPSEPTPQAVCPSNPQGQPLAFNLTAVCSSQISGDYCSEVRNVAACDSDQAIQLVQPYFANCTVSVGSCPLP